MHWKWGVIYSMYDEQAQLIQKRHEGPANMIGMPVPMKCLPLYTSDCQSLPIGMAARKHSHCERRPQIQSVAKLPAFGPEGAERKIRRKQIVSEQKIQGLL